MTWHSFLNLSTMQHRHLLASYAFVLVVQLGYFGYTLWQWRRTRSPRL